jgi:hypothetical protein
MTTQKAENLSVDLNQTQHTVSSARPMAGVAVGKVIVR